MQPEWGRVAVLEEETRVHRPLQGQQEPIPPFLVFPEREGGSRRGKRRSRKRPESWEGENPKKGLNKVREEVRRRSMVGESLTSKRG